MKNNLPPYDRLVKSDTTDIANPQIPKSVDIKIPDKEVHIMQHDEKPPDGGGTCSCHSVCTCVPVNTCTCNMVVYQFAPAILIVQPVPPVLPVRRGGIIGIHVNLTLLIP
jgi:hypothetical protein